MAERCRRSQLSQTNPYSSSNYLNIVVAWWLRFEIVLDPLFHEDCCIRETLHGYEYEYQPRVQLSLSNYPMTNQRPCRAFSNNNVPLRCFSLFVVEPPSPPALPICYRRVTQRPHRAQISSRDFYSNLTNLNLKISNSPWNEAKHTLNSRIIIYFNIVYLFICLDLFLDSSLRVLKIDIIPLAFDPLWWWCRSWEYYLFHYISFSMPSQSYPYFKIDTIITVDQKVME